VFNRLSFRFALVGAIITALVTVTRRFAALPLAGVLHCALKAHACDLGALAWRGVVVIFCRQFPFFCDETWTRNRSDHWVLAMHLNTSAVHKAMDLLPAASSE
jgi:hypothetical protein